MSGVSEITGITDSTGRSGGAAGSSVERPSPRSTEPAAGEAETRRNHRHGHGHGHGHVAAMGGRRDRRDRREGGGAGLSPVLDIGGEVGALVVYLAAEPPGGEIEACPAGELDARFHTGVHHRYVGLGRGRAWIAVFPQVREGSYHLLDPSGTPVADVTVAGGHVRHVDLR